MKFSKQDIIVLSAILLIAILLIAIFSTLKILRIL